MRTLVAFDTKNGSTAEVADAIGAHRILKKAGKLKPEQRIPVAEFALGPRQDDGPANWERPQAQFDRALGKHPSVMPVTTALFGGADPPKKSPRRDIRDWDAISAWADEIAKILIKK